MRQKASSTSWSGHYRAICLGGEREVFANGHFISQVGLVIVELHNDYHLNDFARDVASWGFQAIAPKDHNDGKMIIARPLESGHVRTL